jgi:hypothetical protein
VQNDYLRGQIFSAKRPASKDGGSTTQTNTPSNQQ